MLVEQHGLKRGKHKFIGANRFGCGSRGLGGWLVFYGVFREGSVFAGLFDGGGNLGKGKALWYGYSYVIFG